MKLLTTLFIAIISLPLIAGNSLPNNPHIAVHGVGETKAKPDKAIITLEVISISDKSLEAKGIVDSRVNNLLNGLQEFDIKTETISASSLLTEPNIVYPENGKQFIDGYTATRTVKITLENLNKLNDFIDFTLGVEINEISNIELMSSMAETLIDQANQLAVNDAKTKGASMAKAFDAELGNIYSINSNSYNSVYRFRGEDDFETITVTGSKIRSEPGKYLQASITFSASIDVVFNLNVK